MGNLYLTGTRTYKSHLLRWTQQASYPKLTLNGGQIEDSLRNRFLSCWWNTILQPQMVEALVIVFDIFARLTDSCVFVSVHYCCCYCFCVSYYCLLLAVVVVAAVVLVLVLVLVLVVVVVVVVVVVIVTCFIRPYWWAYISSIASDSTGFEGVAFSLWRENSKRQIAASCLPCLSWSLLETNGRLALLPSPKKKLRSGSQFGGHNCHLQLVETCCRSRGRRFLDEAPSLFAKKHQVMWTTWEKLWC